MNIYSRSSWGARYRDGFGTRAVRNLEVWLHHSVTTQLSPSASVESEKAQVRSLESIGQSRFGGGISYTYVVFPSGRVYQGHSLNRIGAHTAGHNTRGIGIVLAGNYDVYEPSAAQLSAVAHLLQFLQGMGAISRARLNGGHRDTKATGCPGNRAYNKIGTINNLATVGGGGSSAPGGGGTPAPVWKGDMGWPVLSYGMINDYVKQLQAFLGITQDRSFGPATLAAVKSWQSKNGLVADGYVGPATQTKMKGGSKPAPAPKPPASSGLRVDGFGGPATVKRWQQIMGTTQDGVISGQGTADKKYHVNLETVRYEGGGSNLVRAVQRKLGVTADGYLGPNTIKAIQRRLGVGQDGYFGPGTVKALQTRLNTGKF